MLNAGFNTNSTQSSSPNQAQKLRTVSLPDLAALDLGESDNLGKTSRSYTDEEIEEEEGEGRLADSLF